MPTITQSPQSRPHIPSAFDQARPADRPIAGLRRRAHQLLPALNRRTRRLRFPRPATHKLEPMPRMRWYS